MIIMTKTGQTGRNLRQLHMLVLSLAVICLLFLTSGTEGTEAQSSSPQLKCDPCIVRADYHMEALVHGTADDLFWLQIKDAAEQAAHDFGIDFKMQLYADYEPSQLAQDIRNAAKREQPPDVLMVSIPDQNVLNAVNFAMDQGVAIVGVNAGFHWAPEGILGFSAQDDHLAGQEAVDEFLRQLAPKRTGDSQSDNVTISRALFIDYEKGNPTLQARSDGFQQRLKEQNATAYFEELIVDVTDVITRVTDINDALQGCPFEVVMIGGNVLVDIVVSAVAHNGCEDKTLVATSDTNSKVFSSLANSELAFATSQQQYLQGAIPVVLAALYAESGKSMATTQLLYRVGPKIITKATLPSETRQACDLNAFPVCPNKPQLVELVADQCSCAERSGIRIAAVLHGVTTDKFWDPVFQAAEQGARDMDIKLETNRLLPQDTNEILHKKMAEQIISYCDTDIDGIIVSIPDDILRNAIQYCLNKGIPMVSINAGADMSKELGLMNYVGQLDYESGYAAGQRLLASGMRTGYCLNHGTASKIFHATGSNIFGERCRGLADAIAEVKWANVSYGGIINVTTEGELDQYSSTVEAVVGDLNSDWRGVGLLLMGSNHLEYALYLQSKHMRVLLGQFDVSAGSYEPLDDGRLLFAVDQQPYLQGSWPVYLLTYKSYTGEQLLNPVVETGPKFLEASPNLVQQICESTYFQSCDVTNKEDMNYISDSFLATGYFLFALNAVAALVCLGWVRYYRKTPIVKASQPHFLVLVVCGCLLSSLAIVPLSEQTSYREFKSPSPGSLVVVKNPDIGKVDAACSSLPWLYGLGFAVLFSALLAKILTMKFISDAGGTRFSRKFSFRIAILLFSAIIFVEVALNITRSMISPEHWERHVINRSSDGVVTASEGRCTSDKGWTFTVSLLLFHMFCCSYALVLCFKIRNADSDLFYEIKWTSLSLLLIFQVTVLFIPIGVLWKHSNGAYYLLRVFVLFLQNFFVLCLIFGPKMLKIIRKHDTLPAVANEHNRSSTPGRPHRRQESLRITIEQDDMAEHRFPAQEANPASGSPDDIDRPQIDGLRPILHRCPHCATPTNEFEEIRSEEVRRGAEPYGTDGRSQPGVARREQPRGSNVLEPHSLGWPEPRDELTSNRSANHEPCQKILEPHGAAGTEPHEISREPHKNGSGIEPYAKTFWPDNVSGIEFHDKPVLEPHDKPVLEPHGKPVLEPHDKPVLEPHDKPVLEPHDEPVLEPHDKPVLEPHEVTSLRPYQKVPLEPHLVTKMPPPLFKSEEPHNMNSNATTDVEFCKVEEVFSELEHFGSGEQGTVQAEATHAVPASVQAEEKREKENDHGWENIQEREDPGRNGEELEDSTTKTENEIDSGNGYGSVDDNGIKEDDNDGLEGNGTTDQETASFSMSHDNSEENGTTEWDY